MADLDSRWQALFRGTDRSKLHKSLAFSDAERCNPPEFTDIWLEDENGGLVIFEGIEVEGMD